MFDDETRVAFKKMHEFSAADGFVEITETVGDMMRYVANEPSVGLFFVQQHTKNAAHNLIKIKNNISSKSHETSLHTEDLDDCMVMVKAMKECGNPIIGEMLKDINKSLRVISAKPKLGLVSNTSSNFRGHNNGGEAMVLSSAREKATSFKWPLFDSNEWRQSKGTRSKYNTNPVQSKPHELPVSSPSDELEREESSSSLSHIWVPLLEKRL